MFYRQFDVILAGICLLYAYIYKKFSRVMNVKGVRKLACGKNEGKAKMTRPCFQQKSRKSKYLGRYFLVEWVVTFGVVLYHSQ